MESRTYASVNRRVHNCRLTQKLHFQLKYSACVVDLTFSEDTTRNSSVTKCENVPDCCKVTVLPTVYELTRVAETDATGVGTLLVSKVRVCGAEVRVFLQCQAAVDPILTRCSL